MQHAAAPPDQRQGQQQQQQQQQRQTSICGPAHEELAGSLLRPESAAAPDSTYQCSTELPLLVKPHLECSLEEMLAAVKLVKAAVDAANPAGARRGEDMRLISAFLIQEEDAQRLFYMNIANGCARRDLKFVQRVLEEMKMRYSTAAVRAKARPTG